MLRGECGVYYADLYPLLSFLPRFSSNIMSVEDILPLWKASNMDYQTHAALCHKYFGRKSKHLHRSTSSPTLSHSEPEDEKETGDNRWFSSLRKKPARKSDPERALADIPSEHPLQPARNPPNTTLYDYLPLLRIFQPILYFISCCARPRDQIKSHRRAVFTGRKIRPEAADSNVPLEITLFMTNYFAWLMRGGFLTPASATTMINAINSLQDTVSSLERIKNTSLPFAYQAHLRLSLGLFLFFLPVRHLRFSKNFRDTDYSLVRNLF